MPVGVGNRVALLARQHKPNTVEVHVADKQTRGLPLVPKPESESHRVAAWWVPLCAGQMVSDSTSRNTRYCASGLDDGRKWSPCHQPSDFTLPRSVVHPASYLLPKYRRPLDHSQETHRPGSLAHAGLVSEYVSRCASSPDVLGVAFLNPSQCHQYTDTF